MLKYTVTPQTTITMTIKVGIRPYTKKDLSIMYQLSPRAFYTMFKPHEELVGKKLGRYYSILQVEAIFAKLGLPDCLLPDELIKTKLRD